MKPVMDWIIVKDLEEKEITDGGIYIPQSVRDKESIVRSIIVSISEDLPTEDRCCEVGDTIARHKQTGIEFFENKEKFFFVKNESIMGLV